MSDERFMPLFPEEEDIVGKVIRIMRKRENLEIPGKSIDEFLKKLQEQHSEKIQEAVGEFMKKYNSYLDGLITKFPITTDTYWQIYRRNHYKSTIPYFVAEHENDRIFAGFYRHAADMNARLDGDPPIDYNIEPQYELLDRQPERSFGIGVYIFKDNKGHPVETVWDLREKDIPRFQCKEVSKVA